MNRLSAAASPYLLQHRDNPVHWWEWGPEALAEALRLDRPILLSIGYAACHWCHVMAHESFEDTATAELMNALFVNIKVDREERPDIDHVYMSALHALGEQGGWPLTMFLTPEAAPFWGGTYFPRTARWGRPGFGDVLRQIAAIWSRDRDKVLDNAQALTAALHQSSPRPSSHRAGFDELVPPLTRAYDPVNGGIRGAPKFPNPTLLEALWRHGHRHPDAPAGKLAALTFDRMARGGIHDHLAGGFARYSTDELWLAPHFEKMLYDNAQLLELYALDAATSGCQRCRAAAEGIVRWLETEMRLPDGAFAASLDADSEGEEGRFYVWTADEIHAVLGPADAAFFGPHYDVSLAGNWEGSVILNQLDAPEPRSAEAPRLTSCRDRLLSHRECRPRPSLDDKILADWNGLTIGALARAGALLDHPEWIDLARVAFHSVAESHADGLGLAHSCRAGTLTRPGFALDHAAMMRAALALHVAGAETGLLDLARRWSDHLRAHYLDEETGLLRMTRHDAATLPTTPRPIHDDAVPNPNGVYAEALLRLAAASQRDEDRAWADAFLGRALAAAMASPLAHGSILNALDLREHGVEIICVGAGRAAFRAAALRLPYATTMVAELADGDSFPADHPANAMRRVAGEGAAFLCRAGRCGPPLYDPAALAGAVAAF